MVVVVELLASAARLGVELVGLLPEGPTQTIFLGGIFGSPSAPEVLLT